MVVIVDALDFAVTLVIIVFPNDLNICFPFQGSTLRKRKMYEEFLSKVSILGKSLQTFM